MEAKKNQQDIDNNNVTEERDVNHFWGWEDADMTSDDKQVLILHRQYEWSEKKICKKFHDLWKEKRGKLEEEEGWLAFFVCLNLIILYQ